MSRYISRLGTRVLSAAAALLLAMTTAGAAESAAANVTVEATCTEDGYTFVANEAEDSFTVVHLPALGHDYGDWADAADGLSRSRLCGRCGKVETHRISTVPEEDFPTLHLTGSMEGIDKKHRVTLEVNFASQEIAFTCFTQATLQGHSTYGLPKHNYTLRFFRDQEGSSKYKLQLRNWEEEHKYILKANYNDPTQCRNLVGARIWQQMVDCRPSLHARIAALPLKGAVDGFPVQVYLNGEYFGLYTMNLHKDDDLYGMEDGEKAALLICNGQTMPESLFRERAAFLENNASDWELEYCGTGDDAWARDSFNALIDFVMTATDEAFRQELDKYLDVDAAIDYLIFIYALGLPDSGAKDLVMLNYGDVWISSAYDMDEAFGLDAEELQYRAPEEFLPILTENGWDSATSSLLWDRVLGAFAPELRARYTQLRGSVLSDENLLHLVQDYIGSIPEAFYDMDLYLFEDRAFTAEDMAAQIAAYIPARMAALDDILEVDDE